MIHRTGSASVHIGKANTEVTVRQTKQKVQFGCSAFESIPLICGELEGEKKAAIETCVQKMGELFNFVTLPFYWGRFEPERGKPDTERTMTAAKWWRERGADVKGHPLCWHTVCAPWLLSMTDDEILAAQLARIQRDVSDFRGLIGNWDVINEVVIMPIFDKYDNGVTRICKKHGRIELVKKVFAAAKEADPKAVLVINDFDMSESYDILLEGLLHAGVPIDAIGLQSHMHQGYWGREKTEEVLGRFGRFGLPLHFTEINLVSGSLMPKEIGDLNDHVVNEWPTTPEGEERQAREISEFYKILYSNPLVEAITYWNFIDGRWLNAPAGLLTDDARAKPAYEALHGLIKGEWHFSPARLVSDDNGFIRCCGPKGEYAAEFDGRVISFSVE